MEEPGKQDWVSRRARLFTDTSNTDKHTVDSRRTPAGTGRANLQDTKVQVPQSPDRKRQRRNSPVLSTPVNSPMSGISPLPSFDHSTPETLAWSNCNSKYCTTHGWYNCDLCNPIPATDLSSKSPNHSLLEGPNEAIDFNLPNPDTVRFLQNLDEQWRKAFSYAFLFYEARKEMIALAQKTNTNKGLAKFLNLHLDFIKKFLNEGDSLRAQIRQIAENCKNESDPGINMSIFARLSVAELASKSDNNDAGLLFHTKRLHKCLEKILGDLDDARSLAEAQARDLEEETQL